MANLVDKINAKHIRKDVPEIRVGDTVRVDVWVKEGKKERIQAFEGLVIAKKGGSVLKQLLFVKNQVVLVLFVFSQLMHLLLTRLLLLKKVWYAVLNLTSLKECVKNIKLKKETILLKKLNLICYKKVENKLDLYYNLFVSYLCPGSSAG